MKQYIVLFGDTYYPSGWSDYAGDADTVDEAETIVAGKIAEQGERSPEYYWAEIIDLNTKRVVKRS